MMKGDEFSGAAIRKCCTILRVVVCVCVCVCVCIGGGKWFNNLQKFEK